MKIVVVSCCQKRDQFCFETDMSIVVQKLDAGLVRMLIVDNDSGWKGEEGTEVKGSWITIRNKERQFKLQNIVSALDWLGMEGFICRDDIIVDLDADGDLLCGTDCLQKIYDQYSQNLDLLLTYGSYICSSGKPGRFAQKYDTFNGIYQQAWKASHLKSFKVKLFDAVPREYFLNAKGEYFKTCADLAMMFPMMTLAGIERTKFIDDILYIYNDEHLENDHKVRGVLQAEEEKEIRSKSVLPWRERI